jgi:hypothetical protein
MELPSQKRNSEFIEINKESLRYRSKNEHKTPSMIFGILQQLEKSRDSRRELSRTVVTDLVAVVFDYEGD